MGGESEVSTDEQGNFDLSHAESGRIVGLIVPTTHYLITMVLNGGYVTGILTVFMVQGPNKIVLATKLYPVHFLVAAHATIVMISGPSSFTMKPESILNIAKCTVNYAPTHAIRFS
jgi:hypothetical protein